MLSEEQRGKELYDPTAAAVYDIAGTIFIGISVIAIFFELQDGVPRVLCYYELELVWYSLVKDTTTLLVV